MSRLAYNLLHTVLWQGAWFATVLSAGAGLFWLGPVALIPMLALHLWRHHREPSGSLAAPVTIVGLGVAADLLLVHLAGMRIASGDGWSAWPQPWMAGLWVQLATALPASLAWLRGRSWLAALAGAICGPLAYLGGERFGALALPDGWWPGAAIALVWAVALPLAVAIAGPRQPRSAPCPC